MADMTVSQTNRASPVVSGCAIRGRLKTVDVVFAGLTRGAAILVLLILGAVLVSLVNGSWLAFSTFGFSLHHDVRLEPGHRRSTARPPPSSAP